MPPSSCPPSGSSNSKVRATTCTLRHLPRCLVDRRGSGWVNKLHRPLRASPARIVFWCLSLLNCPTWPHLYILELVLQRLQCFPLWLESNKQVDLMGAWPEGEWGGATLPPVSWRANLHTFSSSPHASLHSGWLIPAMCPSPIHHSSTTQSVVMHFYYIMDVIEVDRWMDVWMDRCQSTPS